MVGDEEEEYDNDSRTYTHASKSRRGSSSTSIMARNLSTISNNSSNIMDAISRRGGSGGGKSTMLFSGNEIDDLNLRYGNGNSSTTTTVKNSKSGRPKRNFFSKRANFVPQEDEDDENQDLTNRLLSQKQPWNFGSIFSTSSATYQNGHGSGYLNGNGNGFGDSGVDAGDGAEGMNWEAT